MKRNNEIASEVCQNSEIEEARHFAIDKVTAAHLAVSGLARTTEMDAAQELETEHKALAYMEEAVYSWRHYLTQKMEIYENLLEKESLKQNDKLRDAFDEGNKVISEQDFTREGDI